MKLKRTLSRKVNEIIVKAFEEQIGKTKSQREVALETKINPTVLSSVLTGAMAPSKKMVELLAPYLHLNKEELLQQLEVDTLLNKKLGFVARFMKLSTPEAFITSWQMMGIIESMVHTMYEKLLKSLGAETWDDVDFILDLYKEYQDLEKGFVEKANVVTMDLKKFDKLQEEVVSVKRRREEILAQLRCTEESLSLFVKRVEYIQNFKEKALEALGPIAGKLP